MRLRFNTAVLGNILMGAGLVWSLIAPLLSAYRLISVLTELNSYWFAMVSKLFRNVPIGTQERMSPFIRLVF